MSAWRRKALELFPERSAEIRTGSIYQILGALEADLRADYRGQRADPALADRVFAFAAWCFADRQNWTLRHAVAVGFYEHLPNTPAGRRDIAARLSLETLEELNPLFWQMLDPGDYEALLAEIEAVQGVRLQPPTTQAI